MTQDNSSIQNGIQISLEYLDSDSALRSLLADPYWPKWDSPWWHMTLLFEMGLAKQIPKRAINAMVEQLQTQYLETFPIRPEELPEGTDPFRDVACHCALGNIYQTLSAAGIDVDREIPWIRPWFLKYQLPDGGLNCDNEAYLKNPPPSSMVGTIPPLEAVLFFTPRDLTDAEKRFVDQGALRLIERKLMKATDNPHNLEEKEDEEDWLKLCFPRFYLYDVLRGLSFILKWSIKRKKTLPFSAVSDVVRSIETRFPDGKIMMERKSFDGISSLSQDARGEWMRKQPASTFALLTQVSTVGTVSPYLSRQWQECRSLLATLRL